MKPSMNWFFVFMPVAVILEHVEGTPVPLIFFSAALAILPIASIIVKLVAGSVLAAWMSEILVGAVQGTGKSLGMSDTFIGIIFLAILRGAAESGSAIATARKNKGDLSIGIALGSCVQIALFVAPILALASYAVSPRPFLLSFSRIEILSMFLTILIGVIVASDGRSHWFKGVQLITLYLVIAMMFYFLPAAR